MPASNLVTLAEGRRLLAKKRGNKYHSQKTVVGGVEFASKREARWYGELLMQKRAGLVKSLRLQVPYQIAVNGFKICKYIADFVVHYANGEVSVIDAKGIKTPVYRLKKKLMFAVYGIEIKEG
jgi:hypothetical protein